jgi:hypothetical protein
VTLLTLVAGIVNIIGHFVYIAEEIMAYFVGILIVAVENRFAKPKHLQ